MNRPERPDGVLASLRTPPDRPSSSSSLGMRTDRTDVSLQDRCDLPMGQHAMARRQADVLAYWIPTPERIENRP